MLIDSASFQHNVYYTGDFTFYLSFYFKIVLSSSPNDPNIKATFHHKVFVNQETDGARYVIGCCFGLKE